MTERKRKPVSDLNDAVKVDTAMRAAEKHVDEKKDKPKPKRATKKKTAPKPAQKAKPKAKPKSAFELCAWDRDFTDPEVITAFARNVKAARIAAGLSQRQAAKVINYSRVAIVNMEGGKNGCTLPTMLRLCTVYGCTPNDLLKA